MRRLGNRGLFLRLADRRVRHQVAAHAGPRAVVDVQVAVLHLLGDIADALSKPFPILDKENEIGKQARRLKIGMAWSTTTLGWNVQVKI